jgi:hypothetical protein
VTAGAALNGICAYFTMFPLSFPYGICADMPSQETPCSIRSAVAEPVTMRAAPRAGVVRSGQQPRSCSAFESQARERGSLTYRAGRR